MLKKVLLLNVLLICLPSSLIAKGRTITSSYANSDIGIKIEMPEKWTLYTNRKNAIKEYKEVFPKRKKKNESPLFYGLSDNQQHGCRLLLEPYSATLLEYFDLLLASNPGVNTISAKFSKETETIEWVYNAKQGILSYVFKEHIKIVNGNVLRLAIWTLEAVYQKYEKDFSAILQSTFFLDASGGWQQPWKDLASTLSGDTLSHIKIAVQDTAEETNDCGEEKANLFWEVKGKKNTVYLFGSIHLGKPEFYPFNEKIESAFQSSKNIGVELNQNAEKTKTETTEIVKESMLKGNKTIKDVVPEPVYNNLVSTFEKIGLPIDNFLKFPPWLLSATLLVLKLQSMGYHPDYGVEKYFLDKVDSNKTIIEFETTKEQISLLSSLDKGEFLAYTLLSINTMEVDAKKLINAWVCGNIKALEDILINKYENILPNMNELNEKLLYKRNVKMTAKIKQFLEKDEDYFVILGSAHFIGDKGIIALLTEDGYTPIR